jgi:hypothetical protein
MEAEVFEARDLVIPAGYGPLLAVSREVEPSRRSRRWLDYWLAFVIIFGLLLLRTWPHWEIALPIALVTYAVICQALTAQVRAGDGWLAHGNSFVHTDHLRFLQWNFYSFAERLEMRDADGNRLNVRVSELTRNPEIWRLLQVGVRASHDAGLTVNRRTAAVFGLPFK